MTIEEARQFITQVPWRHIKMVPVGEGLSEEEALERWGSIATWSRTRTST